MTTNHTDTGGRRRWWRAESMAAVMVTMGVFLLLVQVNRTGGGVMANALAAQRGLGAADIGTVMGSMFLASALVQVPFGLMFDRFGPRRTAAWTSMVAVVGMLVFAWTEAVGAMSLGRFLIGVGHGGVVTSVYLLAVTWAKPERVATVSAMVIGIAGGIGGLLATAPLAYALQHVGFSATFTGLALAIGVLTAVIWISVADAPPTPGTTGEATGEQRPREGLLESLVGLVEVVRDRRLWPIFAMGCCFTAPFMTVSGLWAGPYFTEVHGLSETEAGAILLAVVLGLNVGTLAYGPLDRIFASRKRIVAVGALVNVAILAILAAEPTLPLPIAAPMLVVFSAVTPFFVVLAAHCRQFVPAHRVGRAITFFSMLGVGNIFVLQTVSGMIVERVTSAGGAPADAYRLVFAFVAAVLATAVAVYLTSRETPAA
jgi:MFS family permease